MCTAISYKASEHYFGRNLDLEHSYNENIIIVPRKYSFNFRRVISIENHYAMIGMGIVVDNYPLYFDATNERGLSIAGLNFPENAVYYEEVHEKENIAPFELIPWLLSGCSNVREVVNLLERTNIVNIPFSEELTLTPLHWMISDREATIVLEAVREGVKIYDNPVGVLTNNPAFNMQMFNLNNYMQMSTRPPVNFFSDSLELQVYSRGMGALGLPGDLSSQSRFVKAVFTKLNSVVCESDEDNISQFFHVLSAVEQQKGCVRIGNEYEFTIYTSCCNTDKGIYYYTTYGNRCINGVDMNTEDLETDSLIEYPLIKNQQIYIQN